MTIVRRMQQFWVRFSLISFLGHVAVFALAYLFALVLRFDFIVPTTEWQVWCKVLPFIIILKVMIFGYFGAFTGWWRYLTFADLADLLKAAILSSICVATADYLLLSDPGIPRGLLVIDLAMTILLLGGTRASIRLFRDHIWPLRSNPDARRAFVVGANSAGEAIVRQTNRNSRSRYRVVGLLDDDKRHHGARLGGVSVLGSPDDVARLAARADAEAILVAANTLPGSQVRRLMEHCSSVNLDVKIVPPIEDILNGHVSFQTRSVDIDDLLRRDPVALDAKAIRNVLRGKRVMVTGAGGSIGSEICRQIAKFQPDSLILIERFESALFAIHRQLGELHPDLMCKPCIADILDHDRMSNLFEWHSPHIVFHAAAHKHVPMMEDNPGEAIKNNVCGTKSVADLAVRHYVERFVLISTDKAVNPTSVMGVSKHLAERYVHGIGDAGETKFMVVRFGNVLGSIGSVVPIFQEQIRHGGPVTITHPDMCRYFMTIPEASQLVLQAAAMGQGGEIFVLDMGEPVKIIDLAKDMIRLSGFSLDDIQIRFTGLRPGEKLYEELRFDDEHLLPTSHPKLQVAYHRPFGNDIHTRIVAELCEVLESPDLLRQKLSEFVPEYQRFEAAHEPRAAMAVTEDVRS